MFPPYTSLAVKYKNVLEDQNLCRFVFITLTGSWVFKLFSVAENCVAVFKIITIL